MIRRVKVRGIIAKDGKLFCVKHIGHDGKVVAHWSAPGGGLNEGEPLISGLIRELVEETNVKPAIGNLILIQQFLDHHNDEQLVFFFNIENVDEYLDVNLKNTTHGVAEIHEFGFKDPATTHILPKILRKIDLNNIDKIVKPIIINEIPPGAKTTSQD